MKLVSPIEFSEDAFAMDVIKQLGTSGDYLMEEHTALRCRSEFFAPELGIRTMHSQWQDMHPRDMTARAGDLFTKRLQGYQKPDIDSALEKDLTAFVGRRKGLE